MRSKTKIAYITGTWILVTAVAANKPPMCAAEQFPERAAVSEGNEG
jgi:hypothetical protein